MSNLKHHVKIGDIFETNRHGCVKVIEILSATKILVEFEDGTKKYVTKAHLMKGNVGHPTSGITVGYTFETNSGYKGVVKEYISCYEVVVQWEDGHLGIHRAGDIQTRAIKPLSQPSVFDVGYWGYGKYVPDNYSLREGTQYVPSVIKAYWTRMLDRCYNPTTLNKCRNVNYRATLVSDDFKCLQNFTEWALTQHNWDKGFELDKDLLGGGKIYSKETCCFLPRAINIFLGGKPKSKSGLPEGVNYISGGKGGYVARCHFNRDREYLGFFKTPEEAGLVYRKRKEEVAKLLAEEYKDVISPQAYEALLKYEVTMTET